MIEKELRSRLVAELDARDDGIKLMQIEEPYFAALEKALREMPAERKGAAIREVRAHLHAMVEAKRTDGLDEATAWQVALREFGEPSEIGRALWLQCVKSGRVEVEGAPLSKWQKVIKWLLLTVFTMFVCSSMAHDGTGSNGTIVFGIAQNLIYLFWMLQLFHDSALSISKGWLLPFIMGIFPSMLYIFSVFTKDLWRATPLAPFRDYFLIVTTLALIVHSLWQWKRELNLRPWKSSRKYRKNPIAAEQDYRFWPFMLLFALVPFLCVATFSLGAQALSLPFALLAGMAPVGGAFFVGKWLAR